MEAPLFKVCSRCNVLKSHFEQSKRTATRHGVRTIFKTSCTDCTNHARVDRRRLHKIFAAPPPGAPCECCERVPQTLFLDHTTRGTFAAGSAASATPAWGSSEMTWRGSGGPTNIWGVR
jgi:hypothetical protein